MEIDKTLKELSEKVNALASLQIETEMKLARLADSQRLTDTKIQQTHEQLQQFIQRIDNAMGQVANILASHETRIDRLEGNRPL